MGGVNLDLEKETQGGLPEIPQVGDIRIRLKVVCDRRFYDCSQRSQHLHSAFPVENNGPRFARDGESSRARSIAVGEYSYFL